MKDAKIKKMEQHQGRSLKERNNNDKFNSFMIVAILLFTLSYVLFYHFFKV